MPKPWYFMSGTESEEIIANEVVKVASGAWEISRTKRSKNIDAARLLIPPEYHCIPDSGTSTITIEWWLPKPSFIEALKD